MLVAFGRYTESVPSDSVQRILATIVFLCFAVGPGLNLSCLARCAPVSAAEAPASDCHHPADADLQIASAVDCTEHQSVQSPALIVGRIVLTSAWLLGPFAHTMTQPRQTLLLVHGSSSVLTAGPPPSFALTPLRI